MKRSLQASFFLFFLFSQNNVSNKNVVDNGNAYVIKISLLTYYKKKMLTPVSLTNDKASDMFSIKNNEL